MLKLKNPFRRQRTIADDLKTVTEVAGDQIAPGTGTLLLILAGAAVGAAGAYYVSQRRKNKKAAPPGRGAASSKFDKSA